MFRLIRAGVFAVVLSMGLSGCTLVLPVNLRVALLVMLAVGGLACFWLDAAGLPNKAWRRGW